MSPQHTALCTQLRDHLDAELAAYRALLGVAERKQRELVANQVRRFADLIPQEQTALLELGRLRQIRDRLLKAVAVILNLKDGFTMSAALAKMPEPLRVDLARRQADLLAVTDRLKAANERNALLIRQSLGLVRDILSAVLGPEPGAGAYDRRGLGGGVPTPRGGLVNLAG
jgi:flagellar biosynthesis/type III secretory pathway chaperone